jgi:hypothetical protein
MHSPEKAKAKGQELRAAALFPASTLISPHIFTSVKITKTPPHPHEYWLSQTHCTSFWMSTCGRTSKLLISRQIQNAKNYLT